MSRCSFLVKLGVLFLLLPFLITGENRKESGLSEIVKQCLETWHYRSQPLDKHLSEKSFAFFQKSLDSSKGFLLESDINEMKPFHSRMVDEMENGALDLARLGSRLLHERILQVQGFCRDILKQPFDFSEKEWIDLDVEKRSYCRTPDELKSWWRKQLKYLALTRYVNAETARGKAENAGKKEPALTPAQLGEKVRKEVASSMERFFRRIQQERPEETWARFLNAVIATYDPHSHYFPPRDKEAFDIEMSGTLEGIGVLLGEEESFVKVLDVIPGSPAWIQNQIKVEDVLLKVAQGDEEPVDVLGMPVSEVAQLVRGKKGTTVRLTLRKPDGRIMEVSLVRNIIEIQETYAHAAILVNDQLPVRLGYVYLPKFYRDFNRENGRSSADDVRRELEALKKQNVHGVILDLRNNSGGALDDAVRMAGIFIEKGPVVQMKDRRATPQIYRDDDASITYDGPMIVLVNALSASASEILAACLQDYGRAVIMGSSHTFGKGSVQMMLDLDRVVTGKYRDLRPFGAITLTVQKYYRISGASTQYRGIVPDIIVPESTSYLEIGEKYLDNALSWDATEPVPYTKWGHQAVDLTGIVKRSQKRVQESERFQKLVLYYEWLKQRQDRRRISLNLEEFRREQGILWKQAEDWNKLEKVPLGFKTLNSDGKPPAESTANLPSDQQKRMEWLKDLAHDEILDEAMRVLYDMIHPENR